MRITSFTISTMLKEMGLYEDRYRIAGEAIHQRKGLKEMNEGELLVMYSYLVSQGAVEVTEELIPEEQQRRDIITYFRSVGFEKDGHADLVRIKKYIKEVGYLKKGLYEYSSRELIKLRDQIENELKKAL